MKIPVGSKTVINVSGVAVVITALILDNTVTNVIRLKALKTIAEAKTKNEEEEESE